MKTQFDFNKLVSKYHLQIEEGKYPRLMGWEFLWDWVQSRRSWNSLASKGAKRTTALHLGFYLANWGMLRGSSGLLNVNLEFFEDLVEMLFAGRAIPTVFWDMKLEDFAPDAASHGRACDYFDKAISAMTKFSEEVSWTGTLISKVLLGLWGQCPALDTYFSVGLKAYLDSHSHLHVRSRLFPTSRTLSDIAKVVEYNGWSSSTYRTRRGRFAYPIGKIVDMAFFQYGYDRRQEAAIQCA
jgi:hypothetical protein